jgi:hypothetical protein
MNKRFMLALTISLCLIGSAQAGFLVNTGQPTNTTGGVSLYKSFIYETVIYAQFVITQAATITSIEGWINSVNLGPLHIGIYRDNSDKPGNSSILGGQVIFWAYGAAWVQISIGGVVLNPGTYWVGFAGVPSPGPGPYVATMPGPAPAPLGKEGYQIGLGQFTRADDMNIGVRISGYPVRHPSTGSGLLLLGD